MAESNPTVHHFPPSFLWGAATAAHQVEGGNVHSDWWHSEQSGRLPYQSGNACDSWVNWSDDVRLLSDLKLNAYRFSIEWARIEPAPGQFDHGAIDNYRRLIEALRAAGIEPLVTLHHFTSPQWLAERGGWRSPDVVPRFEQYADRVARELGSLVTWWITVNEPSILALKGYLEGSWPPHRPRDVGGFFRLYRHVAAAHAAARSVLQAHQSTAQTSLAFALWPMEPLRAWHPIDRVMAIVGDWFWQWGIVQRIAPQLDWIGVNYYSRIRTAWPRPRAVASAEGDKPVLADRLTDFGWEIYADGLYHVLRRIGRFGKPVIITENGIADRADRLRPRYIVEHLQQVLRAIQAGVDVRGYMHWSLLDNYEWAEGFTQQFGLADRMRQPWPSAYLYRDIAAANSLDANILAPHAAALRHLPP